MKPVRVRTIPIKVIIVLSILFLRPSHVSLSLASLSDFSDSGTFILGRNIILLEMAPYRLVSLLKIAYIGRFINGIFF